MSRVVHFEFPADDPERAVAFYKQVFGWEINKWDGPIDYWLVMTGEDVPGIDGGIAHRGPMLPHTTNTVGVASVDESTAKITKAGGKVVAPKMPIPGMGWLAYCTDTEGNLFGIIENDPSAK
jgi:predicted enzyme related to lactoylglutathione lyase